MTRARKDTAKDAGRASGSGDVNPPAKRPRVAAEPRALFLGAADHAPPAPAARTLAKVLGARAAAPARAPASTNTHLCVEFSVEWCAYVACAENGARKRG